MTQVEIRGAEQGGGVYVGMVYVNGQYAGDVRKPAGSRTYNASGRLGGGWATWARYLDELEQDIAEIFAGKVTP